MIGQTLLHYEIVEKIGEGGMGVVYKARDKHLNRFVAVKVLSAEATANPERKRRFLQEAQAASALNHPNIVHIYDIAESRGADFIAMEYIEGRTLDSLIGRKAVAIGEALKYAIQIADALDKAHAAGIVHRDLKPANVMVTGQGLVKVLDFGLAKLIEPPIASDATTVTFLQTEQGILLGTVPYMSPEQAEGRQVDSRSDIFSFGALLYELVTGRRAFQGASKASTLALVVHEDPTPLAQITQGVPADLEKIITRCLRKDPERRFQHMADLKIALLDLKEESESGKISPPSAPARASRIMRIPAAIAMLALTAGVTWWLTRPRPALQMPIPTPLTNDSGVTFFPAISRDGKLLAYSSDRADGTNLDIWVQQIGGGQPIRLTRHEAPDTEPDFSPDGTRVVFSSARDGGGIYVVPTLGVEAEKRIAERGTGPRFSPDGKWIAYRVLGRNGTGRGAMIFIVPSIGGQPRQLLTEFQSLGEPVWSEDGRYLLAGSFHPTIPPSDPAWDLWAVPIDGGPPVRTGIYKLLRAQGVLYTEPAAWLGEFFYLSGGATQNYYNVWRVPLSSKRLQAAGQAQRITSGTGREAMARVSAAGLLVFAASNININLWSLPLDANQVKVTGKLEQLTRDAGYGRENSLSRDGKKLAYGREEMAGNTDIWVQDLETRKTAAVVTGPKPEILSRITADGESVVYGVVENNWRVGYRVAIRGATPQKLCENCCLFDVSSDETKILSCIKPGPPEKRLVGWLDLASGSKIQLMPVGNYSDRDFRISPDDRWIAFGSSASPDRVRLYVAPVRPGTATERDWIPITDGKFNDSSPRWSPDGRILYFISERDGHPCIWARQFDPITGQTAAEAIAVHHLHTPSQRLWYYTSISVAKDKLVLSLGDTRSNIWMLKVP